MRGLAIRKCADEQPMALARWCRDRSWLILLRDRPPFEAAKPAWAPRTISRRHVVPNSWNEQAWLDGRRRLTSAFACTTPTSSTYLTRYRSAPTSPWCREFYKVAVSWPRWSLKLWMRARSDLVELVTVLRLASRHDHASKDLDITRCARGLAAEQRPRD